MSGFTEDQIKGMVREEVRDYFRMSRPGFEITSNSYTLGHGQSEFCLSTDSGQGMHFYKQGNMKIRSNKSVSLRTSRPNDNGIMVLDSLDSPSHSAPHAAVVEPASHSFSEN